MNHAFIDEHSRIDSIVNRLDPRIKMISFVSIVLFVIFTPADAMIRLGLYGTLIFVLACLSRIPIVYLIKRVLAVVPFILMTSLFIPFLHPQGAVPICMGSFYTGISDAGLILFRGVIIKGLLSLMCVTLLMTSTAFPDFLKAMEQLRCPRLITMILSFMYR